jgi:double-stranded uracil-DNA glycosylase
VKIIQTPCLTSLAAIATADVQILILGSMPGQQSLTQQQYYAHPRNAFWKIIARLFGFHPEVSYADKLLALQQHKLALWDVIQNCERQGSLDSRISNASIICNDFAGFFALHPQIKHIFFNGSRAYQEYHKHVTPRLSNTLQSIPCTRLPSTSPAMTSLTFEQKLIVWSEIKQVLYTQAIIQASGN